MTCHDLSFEKLTHQPEVISQDNSSDLVKRLYTLNILVDHDDLTRVIMTRHSSVDPLQFAKLAK